MPLLSRELSRVLSEMSAPDYQPQKQPRPQLRVRTYGDGASRGWGHLANALWLLLSIIHPRSTTRCVAGDIRERGLKSTWTPPTWLQAPLGQEVTAVETQTEEVVKRAGVGPWGTSRVLL